MRKTRVLQVLLSLSPGGTERLRLTPTPLHSDEDIEALVAALSDVWQNLTLSKVA